MLLSFRLCPRLLLCLALLGASVRAAPRPQPREDVSARAIPDPRLLRSPRALTGAPPYSAPPDPGTPALAPPAATTNADAPPPQAQPAAGPSPLPSAEPPAVLPSGATPTPPGVPAATRPLLMAYYPDWAGPDFPPEKIDFARFDWIDFAFATPDKNFDLSWDGSDNAPDLLRRLVAAAHASGKHVKLSVGGWTGSRYFSPAVSTQQNRDTFVANIRALYDEFGIDGIDIDWEYPAQAGNDGNNMSADDSANFLAFLRQLRAALPPAAAISAAVQTVPFAGADGAPLANVSAFADVLDWVLLMNYDVWGSISPPGPNAPLSDACGNSTQGGASALSALRAWTAAGFPAAKLVLGVPSYGYISRSSSQLLRTRAQPQPQRLARRAGRHVRPEGRKAAAVFNLAQDLVAAGEDVVEAEGKMLPHPGVVLVKNEDGGTDGGQVQFRELVRQGVLAGYSDRGGNSSRLFSGAKGFARGWDPCSSTPYLRSAGARQIVTYDDPGSLGVKAQLVRQSGMRGANMFDVHGDTDEWDLADALARGMGLR